MVGKLDLFHFSTEQRVGGERKLRKATHNIRPTYEIKGQHVKCKGSIKKRPTNKIYGQYTKYKANQVRICVSDSREDEVDDEQVYQDVKEMIDAFQVNSIILRHEFRF